MPEKDEAEAPEECSEKEPRFTFLEKIEHSWIEILATALLALATLFSAYSAYQSSRWHGKAEEHFNRSEQVLIDATQLSDKANQEVLIDILLAADYLDAAAQGDYQLAQSYMNEGFSEELKVAAEAWKKAKEEGIPGTPRNPFLMPEYKNPKRVQSDRLRKAAGAQTAKATDAIDHSDSFLLFTVLFASVLFFAGISTKFDSKAIKVVVLAMGWMLFVTTAVLLLI